MLSSNARDLCLTKAAWIVCHFRQRNQNCSSLIGVACFLKNLGNTHLNRLKGDGICDGSWDTSGGAIKTALHCSGSSAYWSNDTRFTLVAGDSHPATGSHAFPDSRDKGPSWPPDSGAQNALAKGLARRLGAPSAAIWAPRSMETAPLQA